MTGALSDDNITNRCELFDIKDRKMLPFPSLPKAVYSAGSMKLGNNLYTFGGVQKADDGEITEIQYIDMTER